MNCPDAPPLRVLVATILGAGLFLSCSAKDEPAALTARSDSIASGPPAGVPEKYAPLWEGYFASEEAAEKLSRSLPYDRITLERSPCYGTCPVYKLQLNRDGTAEYEGIKFTGKSGRHTGKISLGTFARLCLLLEKGKFETLADRYTAMWTDDTTCTVSVFKDGKRLKAVSDYGQQGPIELWATQELIDSVGAKIDWAPAQVTVNTPRK